MNPGYSSKEIRAYYLGREQQARQDAIKVGRVLMLGAKKLNDVLAKLREGKKLALSTANDEKDKFAVIHEVNPLGVAVGQVRSYSEQGKIYLLGYKPETNDLSCTCKSFEMLNPRYPNSPPNFPKRGQTPRYCKHLVDFAEELFKMADDGDLDTVRHLGQTAS